MDQMVGGIKIYKISHDITVSFILAKVKVPLDSPLPKCWCLTEIAPVLLDGLPFWTKWEQLARALGKVLENGVGDGKGSIFDTHKFNISFAHHTVEREAEVPVLLHAILDSEDYLRRSMYDDEENESSSGSSSSKEVDLTMRF